MDPDFPSVIFDGREVEQVLFKGGEFIGGFFAIVNLKFGDVVG